MESCCESASQGWDQRKGQSSVVHKAVAVQCKHEVDMRGLADD